MKDEKQLDFSLIIASSVHDMKNSLSMLLHSLDEMNQLMQESESYDQASPFTNRMATLQYEAARVNNDLVTLLSLYKLNENMLRANIDEHFVADFLTEQLARYTPLFKGRRVNCEIQCDHELTGYFDRDLISGVINNVITNAIRYCHQSICLKSRAHQGGIEITVEDDGEGFPAHMLDQPELIAGESDFQTGSTNLGLYFSQRIAQLHTQGEHQGNIYLSNEGPDNGGRFSIWLP